MPLFDRCIEKGARGYGRGLCILDRGLPLLDQRTGCRKRVRSENNHCLTELRRFCQLLGKESCVFTTLDIQLAKDVMYMVFNRAYFNNQEGGNLLIATA